MPIFDASDRESKREVIGVLQLINKVVNTHTHTHTCYGFSYKKIHHNPFLRNFEGFVSHRQLHKQQWVPQTSSLD